MSDLQAQTSTAYMHVHVYQFTPLKTVYYVYRVNFVGVGGLQFFVFLNWVLVFFSHSFHFFLFFFFKFHCIERIEMKRKVDKLGIVNKNTSLNRKKQFPCPKLSHNNNSFHDLVPTKATQNKQESLIFTRRSQYLLRHLDINLHRTQCRQIFSIFTSCGNPVFYMSVLQ